MNFNIVFILNLCLISKCTATTCSGAPPTISNGWRSYSSSSATYYCNTGYEGSGNATIDCQYYVLGNYWPSVSYTCTIKDCGTPSTISYGYRSYSSTTYASAANYYCNTGYVGSGTSSITCQSSGAWSALTFSCALRDCGTPVTISNGARSYSATTYGSTATYSCNTGYLGSGSNSITCQSSGSWSALTFSCALRDCGSPPSISNGARSFTTTTYTSVATYSCNAGYSGTGINTITCQSSGSWSSLSYSCALDSSSSSVTSSVATSAADTTTEEHLEDNGCDERYRLMRNIIFGFIAVIVLLLNTYL